MLVDKQTTVALFLIKTKLNKVFPQSHHHQSGRHLLASDYQFFHPSRSQSVPLALIAFGLSKKEKQKDLTYPEYYWLVPQHPCFLGRPMVHKTKSVFYNLSLRHEHFWVLLIRKAEHFILCHQDDYALGPGGGCARNTGGSFKGAFSANSCRYIPRRSRLTSQDMFPRLVLYIRMSKVLLLRMSNLFLTMLTANRMICNKLVRASG